MTNLDRAIIEVDAALARMRAYRRHPESYLLADAQGHLDLASGLLIGTQIAELKP